MKRTLLITFAAAILLGAVAPAAHATDVGYSRKFGLGIEVGDNVGLAGKLWVAPTNGIDFGLGFWAYGFNTCYTDQSGNQVCSAFGYHNASLHADYLWQSNIVRGTAQLDWHVGAGGRTIFWGNCQGDCVALAARAPIGLDLMFTNPSFVEAFFELAPAFWIIPGVNFTIEGELGVRFYF